MAALGATAALARPAAYLACLRRVPVLQEAAQRSQHGRAPVQSVWLQRPPRDVQPGLQGSYVCSLAARSLSLSCLPTHTALDKLEGMHFV